MGTPLSKSIDAFKLVQFYGDQWTPLAFPNRALWYHEWDAWYEAEMKDVRDNPYSSWYTSGWHIMLTEETAYEYNAKFSKILNYKTYYKLLKRVRIVRCEVRNTWAKENSFPAVSLAQHIKITEVL